MIDFDKNSPVSDKIFVNYRPGEKTNALIEVISKLEKKNPSFFLGEMITDSLIRNIDSFQDYGDIFAKVASEIKKDMGYIPKDCALAKLIEYGILIEE